MADEAQLWRHVDQACKGLGAHLVRVENSVGAGTPDVNGSWRNRDFWVELKHLDDWPKRARTVVRIPHYTTEQRLWLRARGRVGGACGLLLRVDTDYLFFNWFYAQKVGQLNRAQLYSVAADTWTGSLDGFAFLVIASCPGPIVLAPR